MTTNLLVISFFSLLFLLGFWLAAIRSIQSEMEQVYRDMQESKKTLDSILNDMKAKNAKSKGDNHA